MVQSIPLINIGKPRVAKIDIDIEGGKRPQVYKALQDVYGHDRVSKVLTIRTEKSKSAIMTACFLPDTLIQTDKGLIKIQDINSYSRVLTVNGYEKVIVPTYRKYNDTIYSFSLSGIGLPLKVTENHQFLICPYNRKKITYGPIRNYTKCKLYDPNGNLIKECLSIEEASRYYAKQYNGSYSSMKRNKKQNGYYIIKNENKEIKDGEIQWLSAKQICKSDFFLSPIYENEEELKMEKIYFSKEEQNPYKKSCVYILEEIKINEDLGELLGFYLAEGNINHDMHGITFTIHKREEFFKEKICSLLYKAFGISKNNISILSKNDTNALTIQVNSTPLGRWFSKYCPGHSRNKRVPNFILNSSKEIQLALLKGCFMGDGYGRQRTSGSFEGKITSISYSLIEGLWQIAARNGYNCSCVTEPNSGRKISVTYNLMFYGKNAEQLFNYKYNNIDFIAFKETEKPIIYKNKSFYPVRINKIEIAKYDGLVYCLETPSHNYLINNIVSHNCRGLGLDNDEAAYLASFIKSDRGIDRTLEQTYYGDEEAGIAADTKFQELMNGKYHKVWEVARFIEGLCSGVGSHAGGVIFYDAPITDSTALMQTTNDDIVTQYDLHRLECVGLIKIDLLSIQALDRIRACLDLLGQYGYIETKNKTLKQIYEDTIGVYNIERNDPKMWKMIHEHKIESLFQMEQQSGVKGIAAVKPETLEELATLNSVIRLMAQEKGAEQPIEKFARFKKDINNWYREMDEHGVKPEYQKLLEPLLLESAGMCECQERLMSLVQLPEVGGYSLAWSDKLRKAIAKKDPAGFEALQAEFYKNAEEKNLDMNLCRYVWDVLVCTSRGYGFNLAHTLGYSMVALQEMNLAYRYPILFWDTANLIVDSGAMNLTEAILDEDDSDEDSEENLKNTTIDYGKIATAIGKMQARNLSFSLPNINKSQITFSPDIENNRILYGLKGITRVGNQLVKEILEKRPFVSIEDFLSKIKVNKTQMISLIKAGVFDELYSGDRIKVMNIYLNMIADKKQRITLQNMQMLITKDLIPESLSLEKAIFNFNKFLKKNLVKEGYHLDTYSFHFFTKNFDDSILENVTIENDSKEAILPKVKWDSLYKKAMNPVRDWMKENQQEILQQLNDSLYKEIAEKYAKGNVSKWEMDSLSFYYHEHELAHLQKLVYNVDDFTSIKNDEIESVFPTKDGRQIPIYKIHRIAGTVVDKNKTKNMITLLTPSGVVTIKIWKNQFGAWDKQISEKDIDGKKHVLEKSWFTRGTKLIVTGIRRDDTFIPKKYKNTKFPLFEKIISIDDRGFITESTTERIEGDD